MSTNKTIANQSSVDEFLSKQPDLEQQQDCRTLIKIMSEISNCPPVMWGSSIVGFDSYHYKYDSGREGDMCIIGFSPRKAGLSIYLVDGVDNYKEKLQNLGKYKNGKSCLYLDSLKNINLDVLRNVLKASYTCTKSPHSNST